MKTTHRHRAPAQEQGLDERCSRHGQSREAGAAGTQARVPGVPAQAAPCPAPQASFRLTPQTFTAPAGPARRSFSRFAIPGHALEGPPLPAPRPNRGQTARNGPLFTNENPRTQESCHLFSHLSFLRRNCFSRTGFKEPQNQQLGLSSSKSCYFFFLK